MPSIDERGSEWDGLRVAWAGRTLTTAQAEFGAKKPDLKLRDAQIVLAEPLDCSTKLMNTSADGNVVLVERGNVFFVEKAINAQNAGATAVIIYNNEDGPPLAMTGDDAAITIPVVGISQADGTQLAAAIEAGRTTISLQGACSFSQVAACDLLHLKSDLLVTFSAWFFAALVFGGFMVEPWFCGLTMVF